MDASLFLNFFFSANFDSPTGYDLSSNNLKSCLSVKKNWSDSFLFSNKIKTDQSKNKLRGFSLQKSLRPKFCRQKVKTSKKPFFVNF